MSLTSFLFQGASPPNVQTTGQTTQALPQFMQDYMQNVLGSASAAGMQPYQGYQGPRIAGFSPQQQQAQGLVSSGVGSWQPGLTQANNFTTAAGQNSPLAAASPYMDKAAQSFNDPSVMQSYLNPYTKNVIAQGTNAAMQNFNENVMPQLNNQFTAAGQYGSSAHQRQADIDARNLTTNLQLNDQAALAQGYNTAGQLFGADAGRQGALAQTAGQLGAQQGYLQLGAGQQQGALAQAQQAMGLKDAAALDTSGAEQQGLAQQNLTTAYQDFLAQRGYPMQQANAMAGVLSQVPHPMTTTDSKSAPLPGAQYGPSPLAQVGALTSMYQGLTAPNGLLAGGLGSLSSMFGGSGSPASGPSTSTSTNGGGTDAYGNPMGSTDIYGSPYMGGVDSSIYGPSTDMFGNTLGTGGYTPTDTASFGS